MINTLIDQSKKKQLLKRFRHLYGDEAPRCMDRLSLLLGRYEMHECIQRPACRWSQDDVVLITYGDMVTAGSQHPLTTLRVFLEEHLAEAVSTVHILPFSPYSSDDGFSVIDYRQVDPALGTWQDIEAIAKRFVLMGDLVLNHVSRQSRWFHDYIGSIAPYRHYFIEVDPDTDLSSVVRPRSGPLTSEVQTRHGLNHVWTTFSEDQIDLNFSNPDVLFEFLDILLYYLSKGMRVIRLDAIAYLWKKIGTSCIHLKQTHEVVKIFRDIMDLLAPNAILLTETNVPHEENISYFGRQDEAHMVYQFSLAPLLLHGLINESAASLSTWAAALPNATDGCTYLNFTASHDGIGVRPLQGLISDEELNNLLMHVEARQGHVSYKRNSDGSQSPYELNITYYDALRLPSEQSNKLQVRRFICSQTVALSLQGIPALYFNSLVAGENNLGGVEFSGQARSINRAKWQQQELNTLIQSDAHPAGKVFHELRRRLLLRKSQAAFHPDAGQEILELGPDIFAVLRQGHDSEVLCLFNFTSREHSLTIPDCLQTQRVQDLLSGDMIQTSGTLTLQPYDCVWLSTV